MIVLVPHDEVLRRLREHYAATDTPCPWVGMGSPRGDYREALSHDLVTPAELDAARIAYGPRWHYAGD